MMLTRQRVWSGKTVANLISIVGFLWIGTDTCASGQDLPPVQARPGLDRSTSSGTDKENQDDSGEEDDDENDDEDSEPAGTVKDTEPHGSIAPAAPSGPGGTGHGSAPSLEAGSGPAAKDEEREEPGPDLLMQWLGAENSPVRTRGWFEAGIFVNSNSPAGQLNFGVNDGIPARRLALNQFYWIVEKPVEQGDRFDWGIRVDNLVGTEWSVLHSTGFLGNAFRWGEIGWEPVQFYGEVHLPLPEDQGLDLKFGRFYALQGFEEGMAPYRPLYSTSYLYNFARPATYMGMLATWHPNEHTEIYSGVINAPDLWVNQGLYLNYAGGFYWESEDESTQFTAALTVGPGIARQEAFASAFPTGSRPAATVGSDIGSVVLVSEVLTQDWSNAFSSTLELVQGTVSGLSESHSHGTKGDWFGGGLWLSYDFSDTWTGIARFDALYDRGGTRTGYDGVFQETTLGLTYNPTDWFKLRPEIRYDWANGIRPYGGQRSEQLTFSIDAIFQF